MISLILPTVVDVWAASVPISPATTANPFPASPALAASIEAFNASRFVWLEISRIACVNWLIFSTAFACSMAASVFCCTFSYIWTVFSLAACVFNLSWPARSFTSTEDSRPSFEYRSISVARSLMSLTVVLTVSIVAAVSSIAAASSCVVSVLTLLISRTRFVVSESCSVVFFRSVYTWRIFATIWRRFLRMLWSDIAILPVSSFLL